VIAAAVIAAAALVAGSGLDCSLGVDALAAQMKALPKLQEYAGRDALLATYNDSAGLALYVVTKPGHAAHPAIAKRKINGMGPGMTIDTSACGYGDKAGFDQLMQDIDVLNAGVRKSYGG
jgi:hypothetical protein